MHVSEARLNWPGNVTVNKRFVRESLRVCGILFTNRVSYKMADHEVLGWPTCPVA